MYQLPTLALSKSGKVEGTTPSSQPAVASSLEFVVMFGILRSSQVGRGLLASSHAGTRLPIALIRPRRSPPSAAPLREMRSLPFQTKKQRHLIPGASERIRVFLPTSALPASG